MIEVLLAQENTRLKRRCHVLRNLNSLTINSSLHDNCTLLCYCYYVHIIYSIYEWNFNKRSFYANKTFTKIRENHEIAQ